MIWLGSFWTRLPSKPAVVSIARWSPQWFKGPTLFELAPVFADGTPFGKVGDKRRWIELYQAALSERGRLRAARRRVDGLLAEHADILLACWCKTGRFRRDDSYSGNFCHRLLAGRLLSRLGYAAEVVDLDCSQCRGQLSFDGAVVAGEFVCKRCSQA